ncbi:hypothetical protein ACFW5T_30655, partial [Streptomyces sp. NPDC058766]
GPAARVRAARLVPHQPVVGAREAAAGVVAARLRDGQRPGALPAGELLRRIGDRVAARGADLWERPSAAPGSTPHPLGAGRTWAPAAPGSRPHLGAGGA